MFMSAVSRLAVTCLLVGSVACAPEQAYIGPGASVDMAASLGVDVSTSDIADVQDLLKVAGGGTEFSLLEGLQAMGLWTTQLNESLVYVQFESGTTAARMEEVRAILETSTLVLWVEEDYELPDG